MTNQSDHPEQIITPLMDDDRAQLDQQREVIEQLLDPSEETRRKYATPAGKLGTIRAVLQAGMFQPDQTYELQCLGVVLGDVFVQEMKMEWVAVEDAYGRYYGVQMPGTSVLISPVTMISKRVERGEQVDVFDLFNGIAQQIDELVAKGA